MSHQPDFSSILALITGADYMDDRTGCQLCISRYGEPILDVAVGFQGDGQQMTNTCRMAWLCNSKPVLLIPLMRALTEAGADEDTLVARFIPEFRAAGKGDVTLAHLLTYTVPYRSLGLRWTGHGRRNEGEDSVMSPPWDVALKTICEMPLRSELGTSVTYTAATNWHVLAEILQRLTGRPYQDSMREQVFEPLGMSDTCAFLTEETVDAVEWTPLRLYPSDGTPVRDQNMDSRPWAFSRWPGLTLRGPARDMRRPIECIAGWRHPQSVDADWRAKFLRPRRTDLEDPMFEGSEILWSLGLCVDPVAYGLPLSKQVVGYIGFKSSFVVADLDTGYTVSFISSRLPPRTQDWARKRRLIRAIYQSLGMPVGSAR